MDDSYADWFCNICRGCMIKSESGSKTSKLRCTKCANTISGDNSNPVVTTLAVTSAKQNKKNLRVNGLLLRTFSDAARYSIYSPCPDCFAPYRCIAFVTEREISITMCKCGLTVPTAEAYDNLLPLDLPLRDSNSSDTDESIDTSAIDDSDDGDEDIAVFASPKKSAKKSTKAKK